MTGGMIIKPPASALDQYDPNRHRLNVAAIDYSIDEAKRIRDWPALEKAVDAKIEEQSVWHCLPSTASGCSAPDTSRRFLRLSKTCAARPAPGRMSGSPRQNMWGRRGSSSTRRRRTCWKLIGRRSVTTQKRM